MCLPFSAQRCTAAEQIRNKKMKDPSRHTNGDSILKKKKKKKTQSKSLPKSLPKKDK